MNGLNYPRKTQLPINIQWSTPWATKVDFHSQVALVMTQLQYFVQSKLQDPELTIMLDLFHLPTELVSSDPVSLFLEEPRERRRRKIIITQDLDIMTPKILRADPKKV